MVEKVFFHLHGTQTSKLLTKLNWCKWFSMLDFDIRLSLAWCNIDCSQLMFWSNCYQLQLVYPTLEHCPVKNLQLETVNHFWQAQQKSFLHFSCIFTFLIAIKHNLPKMLLFSSLLNIKMTTEKIINFDTFFKMHKYTYNNKTMVSAWRNRVGRRQNQKLPIYIDRSVKIHLKITGVGCHASQGIFLQGIFLTQRSNPNLLCLLCWQVDSSPLAPPRKSPI